MTPSITGEVRGDDVVGCVAATVTAREQMLRGGLQLACLSKRHALRGDECGGIMTPHWLRAVVAKPALEHEGGVAKAFDGFLAHGSPENG